MIDWLTLSLDPLFLPESQRQALYGDSSHIIKLIPKQYESFKNGFLAVPEWDSCERRTLRSDDYQITISLGANFTISGSPARVDQTHNIFGSSDIVDCALKMISFTSVMLDVDLPIDPRLWACTRIDFNNTLWLSEPSYVRQALQHIIVLTPRQIKNVNGTTVAFGSRRSNLYLKFYDKSLHLTKQLKQEKSRLSIEHQQLSTSLLRVEITLNAKQIKSMSDWFTLNKSDFQNLLDSRVNPLIGSIMINNQNKDIFQILFEYTKSDTKANNLFTQYNHIRTIGLENFKSSVPQSKYYRVKKALFDAGLSYSDLTVENTVTTIKREPLNLGNVVTSFDDIKLLRSVN